MHVKVSNKVDHKVSIKHGFRTLCLVGGIDSRGSGGGQLGVVD